MFTLAKLTISINVFNLPYVTESSLLAWTTILAQGDYLNPFLFPILPKGVSDQIRGLRKPFKVVLYTDELVNVKDAN